VNLRHYSKGLLRNIRPSRRPGSGQIVLNGAAAFQGKKGDLLTIMSFAQVDERSAAGWKPRVIVLGKDIRIVNNAGI
jgi:aspartate 1-decarboxylase